jgi:hypothetical protein
MINSGGLEAGFPSENTTMQMPERAATSPFFTKD